MVRLKAQMRRFKQAGLNHFNSSMVRLKASMEKAGIQTFFKFQFQYGAIKRNDNEMKALTRKLISIPVWCD